MKNFIFATVSGLGFLVAQGVVAKEDTATPPTTTEKKASAPSYKNKTKHHKHHATHRAQSADIYVAFPPVRECGCDVCTKGDTPQYYASRQDCPYVYHGGYFWYPNTQGALLKGYTPYYAEGRYWYPSRLHPHTVYVERASMVYAYPYSMQTPNPVDDELYEMQTSPMAKKWESAPDKQGAAAE